MAATVLKKIMLTTKVIDDLKVSKVFKYNTLHQS